MPSPAEQRESEDSLVGQSRAGDVHALAQLRERLQGPLERILLARGASQTEAADILADLWADCVPGAPERPSLLDKFSGKCTIQGWLATVATNRWIDFKRRDARRAELPATESGEERTVGEPQEGLHSPLDSEPVLIALLRDSLETAFARCPAQQMVLLRLVYLHGLSQREVGRMLGWGESKVSRFLSQAMIRIQKDTLRELKEMDPLLELTWQDFVDLCETHQVGFL